MTRQNADQIMWWKRKSVSKLDWLAGRMALKHAYLSAIGERKNIPDVSITHEPSGAPRINGGKLFASIAHSQGWGFAAVSPRRVGVDLEFVSERSYPKELLEHIGTDEEYTVVLRHGSLSISEQVIRIWTIKESVRKALGQKRPYHPSEFTVAWREKDFFVVSLKEDMSWWRVKQYVKGGLVCAVAEQHNETRPFSKVIWQVASLF